MRGQGPDREPARGPAGRFGGLPAGRPARPPGPGAPDWGLLAIVAALLAFGVVMVFSSSFYWADATRQDPLDLLKREVVWVSAGLAAMLAAMRIHPRRWAAWCRFLLPLFLVLLMVVLVPIPGLTETLGGARRWFGHGSFTIQPSEFMKVILVIFLANLLDRRAQKLAHFWSATFPAVAVVGIVFGLVLLQPNFSTALIIAGTAYAILFVGDVPWRHLAALVGPALPLFIYLAFAKGYRAERMVTFWNPLARAGDEGYQISQALYAMGSGGLTGVGLGQGRAKLGWLPESYSDMIFAVLAEELGFAGAAVLIGLFVLFVWRGYHIAMAAPDRYMRLLAFGLTTLVAIQAVLNIGVVTASLPPTGVPLPFITYGGSSLTVLMMGVGILLSVSRYRLAGAGAEENPPAPLASSRP